MNAVWTLASRGVNDSTFLIALMNDPDPGFLRVGRARRETSGRLDRRPFKNRGTRERP